jgi:HAD superfamily hydrolase (TIGR01509 family)
MSGGIGAAGAYPYLVAHPDACLLDAYDTIVHTDFSAHRNELPKLAGISADAMFREFSRLAPALSVGEISIAGAYAQILRACGVEPRPELVRAMTDKSRELLLLSGRLYDDVLPFLRTLKSRGIKIAIVSNCDENTRDLLVELGVAALADALVLSNEVGAAKPAPQIYQYALDELGVGPGAALFADNNATYCAGAAALGIRAVQIVRGARVEGGADVPTGPVVIRSLKEFEAMF